MDGRPPLSSETDRAQHHSRKQKLLQTAPNLIENCLDINHILINYIFKTKRYIFIKLKTFYQESINDSVAPQQNAANALKKTLIRY